MNPIRVLLVEDDEEISRLLTRYLEKESYQVVVTDNGEEAMKQIDSEQGFDLVALDLMLRGTDGYKVLAHLREVSNIPVLIISAKSDELDKVVGLRLGADDYLGKPFGIAEFIARVNAIIRRFVLLNGKHPHNPQGHNLEYKGLVLNDDHHTCVVNSSLVHLTSIEFKLLRLLMLAPNKVFTKDEIVSAVWKDEFILDDNKLLVLIRRLRKKIEEDPSEPVYIQTVWGVGYKLGERQDK